MALIPHLCLPHPTLPNTSQFPPCVQHPGLPASSLAWTTSLHPNGTSHSCSSPIHSLPVSQSEISLSAHPLMWPHPDATDLTIETNKLPWFQASLSIPSHNSLSSHPCTSATMIFHQFLKWAPFTRMQGQDTCCFLCQKSHLHPRVYQHNLRVSSISPFLQKPFLISHTRSGQ